MITRIAVVGVASLLFSVQSMGAPSIASLWKARALDALDRLQVLQKERDAYEKRGTAVNSPEFRRLTFQAMIELAYAAHLDLKVAPFVHDTKGKDRANFHLLLKPAGGTMGLDLIYTYVDGKLFGAGILQLPENWKVVFPKGKNQILITDEKAEPLWFLFDLDDPLAARVYESTK